MITLTADSGPITINPEEIAAVSYEEEANKVVVFISGRDGVLSLCFGSERENRLAYRAITRKMNEAYLGCQGVRGTEVEEWRAEAEKNIEQFLKGEPSTREDGY